MTDYPDFAHYKIQRFGTPLYVLALVTVANGDNDVIYTLTGPVLIYSLWCYLYNEPGAEVNNFNISLDGAVFAGFQLEGLHNVGNYQIWHNMVTLSQYDTVNGNFGMVVKGGITFEDSLEIKHQNISGADVDARVIIHYADLV